MKSKFILLLELNLVSKIVRFVTNVLCTSVSRFEDKIREFNDCYVRQITSLKMDSIL